MPIILGFAGLLTLYGTERLVAWRRRSQLEARRAKAAYPTTENDPPGRIIML